MTTNQQAPEQFIQSLKRAGIVIGNEREVMERLGEAREWRYAFSTLANHGKTLGIWFAAGAKIRSTQLKRLELPSVFRLPKGGFHATSFS